MTKFCISKPFVWLYKTEDLCGEVSDELLFGTSLEVLSENETCAYCETDYGYRGYLSRWEICECEAEDCGNSEKTILQMSCDLLYEPRYRLAPYMSLSKGARIKILGKHDERFSMCLVGNKTLYIPSFALSKRKYPSFGEAVAATALEYLGVPYRWGGKSSSGIDCSGLAFMSYRLCGKMLWRDAVPDKRYVRQISESEVRAGDLAYFKGHVAVMTDRESYVHASASRGYVVKGKFGDGVLSINDVLCFARAVN